MENVKNQVHSLAEAVYRYSQLRPKVSAIVDKNGPHTYECVWEEVALCAEVMNSLGVKKSDRVLMECTQDALFLDVDLACELTGAVFVGVERKVAPGRLEEIVRQTEPVLVVTRKAILQNVRNISAKDFQAQLEELRLRTDLRQERMSQAENAVKMISGDDLAEILFSTGTTGKSKGAMLTNRANVANAQNIIDGVCMGQDAVELVPLPINHAHGLRTAYAHFLNGSTVLVANGITFPRVIFEMMEKYGANAIDLSPSAAQMLMNNSEKGLREIAPRIEYVEVGTAFLPEGTKQMLREFFPDARLYNCYGSSESGRTCTLEFSKITDLPDCIGKAVPNAQFAVMGPDGKPMESDFEHTGLLASAGPMNMSGYWGEPELTEKTLRDGYVLTADMSYIDENGYIYVFGRADEVIVYKGIKISPDEIEEAARGCELVADCALVPVADDVAGQVPKLFVVPEDPESFKENDLFSYLKHHIDDNRMPRTIEVIESIPRTYNGKIRRKELIGR